MKRQLFLIMITFLIFIPHTLPGADNALLFDGTDDYVAIPHHTALNVSTFSIEMYFKWMNDISNDVNFLIGKGMEQLEIHTGGDSGNNGLRFIPTTGVYLDTDADVFETGKWYHLAFVYDPANTFAACYLDGVGIGLTSRGSNPVGTAMTETDAVLNIGKRAGDFYYFDGEIDELRIWNTARTQTQIVDNMKQELTGNETGLIAYYSMNEGTDTTLNDLTANGNDGTIDGATWTNFNWHVFSGGYGTTSQPYEIANLTDLLYLSDHSELQACSFEQSSNIDASSTSSINGGAGFKPIGFDHSVPFTGDYNGLSHTISGLYTNGGDNVGIFGYLNGADIRNLGVINAEIHSAGSYSGILAGQITNNTIIQNCFTGGTVYGEHASGGLVGSTIYGSISNCYSTADIISNSHSVGGFVGLNGSCSIDKCFSTGNVSAVNRCGGFVGYFTAYGGYPYPTISNCYSRGNVTRSSGTETTFGGFGGTHYEIATTYTNCYATGKVYSSPGVIWGTKGFMGEVNSTKFNNNFWDTEASEQSVASDGYSGTGILGKTSSEMSIQTTFTSAGWDFASTWAIDFGVNDYYPYFQQNTPPEEAATMALASFTATVNYNNGTIVLNWETTSQDNNVSFILYRNDTQLTILAGAGTTSDTISYTYTDDNIENGISYTYVLATRNYAGSETVYDDDAVTATLVSDIENAPDYDELTKIVANDRAASDQFGCSVSVDGNYAIVGAYGEDEDENGLNTFSYAGAAYILFNNSGNWQQLQKIVASDRAESDYFGQAVAISGDYAIVGARSEDEDASGGSSVTNAGAAYIFYNNNGTWEQMQKIVASDRIENNYFGQAVAISENYAIVSSSSNNNTQGAAYVFHRNGNVWSQTQKLTAPVRSNYDAFGNSLDMDGDYAIIAAYLEDEDANEENTLPASGSAYIFVNNSGTWSLDQKIVASDRAANDEFGYSVAISDSNVIVGSYYEDLISSNGNDNAGAAYIFSLNNGTWEQVQKIVSDDRASYDLFGTSVDISGKLAVVGAKQEDEDALGTGTVSSAGSAYIFYYNNFKWEQLKKVTAPERHSDDNFGFSAGISEDAVIVSAIYEDEDINEENYMSGSGSVYLFTSSSETALPITLASFAASAVNGTVELSWETASETNNARFLIYRNGEVIASVEGAGTTSEPHHYTFVDDAVVPGVSYTYVLADMDYANTETKYEDEAVTVTLANDIVEADFVIGDAYPNPFNPSAVLPVELNHSAMLKASLYDLNGREIQILANSNYSAGSYDLRIDGANLTTGLYLVRVLVDDILEVQKIALVK